MALTSPAELQLVCWIWFRGSEVAGEEVSRREMGLREDIWRDGRVYLESINTVSNSSMYALPSWSASSTSWYV